MCMADSLPQHSREEHMAAVQVATLGTNLLGASPGRTSNELVITLQGDGIAEYDLASMVRLLGRN